MCPVIVNAVGKVYLGAGADGLDRTDGVEAVGEAVVTAQHVVVGAAQHDIVAATACNVIVADTAIDIVGTGTAVEIISVTAAEQPIRIVATAQDIRAVGDGSGDRLAEHGNRRDEGHGRNQASAGIANLVTDVKRDGESDQRIDLCGDRNDGIGIGHAALDLDRQGASIGVVLGGSGVGLNGPVIEQTDEDAVVLGAHLGRLEAQIVVAVHRSDDRGRGLRRTAVGSRGMREVAGRIQCFYGIIQRRCRVHIIDRLTGIDTEIRLRQNLVTAPEDVTAMVAIEIVVAVVADEQIVVAATEQQIGTRSAVDAVLAAEREIDGARCRQHELAANRTAHAVVTEDDIGTVIE